MNNFFTTQKSLDIAQLEENISYFLKLVEQNNYILKQLVPKIASNYSDASHCVNVSLYAIMLGREEGYNHQQLSEISLAGLLHDIGKIKISREILDKTSHLSEDEFESIQDHPLHSEALAKELGVSNINTLAAIRCHHENFDGTGYPNRIKGKAIPKMAQIVGICDAFDALTSRRNFRDQYSTFDALMLIKDEMAEHFNPKLRNDFIKLFG